MVALRRARYLLNKIALEKFARHVQAFRELLLEADISEYSEIIELIGHHAVEGQGNFVMLYSMLLRDLATDNETFRRELLERIELAMRLGLESDNDREKSEFMTIIEIVGWLCCNSTISPEVIKSFIENAFMHNTPVALEAICHVLNVMKSCNEKLFDPFYNRLAQAWTTRFPNRLRFLILDLLELRERRWLPRRPGYLPMMTLSDFRHYVINQPIG